MKPLISLMAFLVVASGSPPGVQSSSVSMVQLIATPERFEGQKITVAGFATLMPESFDLFLNREDYEHVLNGHVWLAIDEQRRSELERFNKSYVYVTGVFTAKRHGHLDASLGEIAVERMIPGLDYTERKSTFGCSK